MKGAERFGDLIRLPGADTMLLGRRHMPCCDTAGEVLQRGWEMLTLPYKPGNRGALAHAEVCAAVTRHLPLRELLLRLVWESLCSVWKWRCVRSSPVSLEKGQGVVPVEQHRKGEMSHRGTRALYRGHQSCGLPGAMRMPFSS